MNLSEHTFCIKSRNLGCHKSFCANCKKLQYVDTLKAPEYDIKIDFDNRCTQRTQLHIKCTKIGKP